MAYFAAEEASQTAWQLERCGKELRFDEAGPLVKRLYDHVEQISPELDRYLRGNQ